MNYRNYITEVTLNTNPELQSLFDTALKQVFTIPYEKRIDKILKREIDIREKKERPGVVAFSQGKHIFINPEEFYQRDKKQQIRYILHEFIHILQKSRGLVLRKFREVKKLTNKLNKILRKHLTKPLSVFLTGKNQNLGAGGKWEILSYFMNDSIDWTAISPEGKREIISALRESGMFDVQHPFWQKRLS